MSATAVAPLLQLDDTFGALLIGVFIAAALWGITCSQTFMYFINYPKDSLTLKMLVLSVWLFDTTHQALICHVAYTYLVTNFNQLPILNTMVNTLIVEVWFNGLVALLVQSFFARRVWILSNKNIVLTVSVMAFVLAEFVAVMYYAARGISFTKLTDLAELKSLSLTVNALAAAGDVLIAFILCWILQTSRTGFKRSDTVITRLIAFSINTGLVTSICALLSLITITVFPNAFIYITFYFTLGRLYSNSLLATLNARRNLAGVASGGQDISMSTRSAKDHGISNTLNTMRANPPHMSIKVDTDRRVDYDQQSDDRALSAHYKEDFLQFNNSSAV